METLTIGKLARLAEVGVETIRFYERKGLLDEPPRRESGYRQYPEDTVRRLRFIRRAKELGFTLKEIKQLLELRLEPASRTTCEEVRRVAKEKLADVRDKIEMLQRMEAVLRRLVGDCQRRVVTGDCPILETLDRDEVP